MSLVDDMSIFLFLELNSDDMNLLSVRFKQSCLIHLNFFIQEIFKFPFKKASRADLSIVIENDRYKESCHHRRANLTNQ